MYDSDGIASLQARLERFETRYGFDTTKLIERIRDTNDPLSDVPDAEDWLQAHRSLTRGKLPRGAWEAGVYADFDRLDNALEQRKNTAPKND